MELVLNLVWMMLSGMMIWFWLRHAARAGVSRKTQIIALAMILLILLPAISVTDDLVTAQNPAESDSIQRKDQLCSIAHLLHLPAADLPSSVGALIVTPSYDEALALFAEPVPEIPATHPIETRPPPAV